MRALGGPPRSLLVQLLTLTGLTLVAAWAMSTLLLFLLPPPAPDFYRISEIERTFHGRRPPSPSGAAAPGDAATRPPTPELEGRTIPTIRDKIAENLGVRVERRGDRRRTRSLSDRRVGRIIRDRVGPRRYARGGALPDLAVPGGRAPGRRPLDGRRIPRPASGSATGSSGWRCGSRSSALADDAGGVDLRAAAVAADPGVRRGRRAAGPRPRRRRRWR